MKKLTNEEFLQRLKDKNILYIPLEEYKDAHSKIKWMCHKNSKHIFEARPDHIYDGRGCPYCYGYKVFVGETDLWTTNPEIATMLEDSNEGYLYSAFSGHKTNWKCPDCGKRIKDKAIKNITSYGLCCPICSDGISYPEKFIMSMLMQLNIDFIHDQSMEWSGKKRYDFYIKDYNMIVECHGLQHYEEVCFGNKTLKEQIENDAHKEELALSNGIKYYIQLDCRKSEKGYIHNSVLNSELSILFNLFDVNWNECDDFAHKSYYIDILTYYNNGMKNPVDIANEVKLSHRSVLDALHKLTEDGLCNYNSKKHLSEMQCKRVICLETNKIYYSIKDTSNDGFSPLMVSRCCNDYIETYRGLHWMFYDEYLKQNSEDNYGEAV